VTDDTQVTAPQDWTSSFTPELKDIVAKNGFSDPAAVVKAYGAVLPLLGADKIALPKDGVWDDVARERLGIPKDGAYQVKRPELEQGMTWDETFEKAFLPVAHKLGFTPQQVQGLIDFYAAAQISQHKVGVEAGATREAELKTKFDGFQKELKTEWGQAYDERVALAGRALKHVGGDALIALMNEELKGGGMIGDNPAVLRAFAKLGEQLGESVLKTGAGGSQAMTPAQAETEARRIMATPEYTSKDPAIRNAAIEKVNKLFGLQYDNTQDVRRVATMPG
jgi:hypothetical protein